MSKRKTDMIQVSMMVNGVLEKRRELFNVNHTMTLQTFMNDYSYADGLYAFPGTINGNTFEPSMMNQTLAHLATTYNMPANKEKVVLMLDIIQHQPPQQENL